MLICLQVIFATVIPPPNGIGGCVNRPYRPGFWFLVPWYQTAPTRSTRGVKKGKKGLEGVPLPITEIRLELAFGLTLGTSGVCHGLTFIAVALHRGFSSDQSKLLAVTGVTT